MSKRLSPLIILGGTTWGGSTWGELLIGQNDLLPLVWLNTQVTYIGHIHQWPIAHRTLRNVGAHQYLYARSLITVAYIFSQAGQSCRTGKAYWRVYEMLSQQQTDKISFKNSVHRQDCLFLFLYIYYRQLYFRNFVLFLLCTVWHSSKLGCFRHVRNSNSRHDGHWFRVISAHNKIGPCQFRPMSFSAHSNFGP